MDSPFLVLALPPLLLVPAMGLLSRIESRNPVQTEIRRKALHVSVGLISLSFPVLLKEPWMVVTALLAVAAWMQAVRHIPCVCQRFGGVLHDADRKSYGELYFTLAIAVLLLLSGGEPVLYIAPLLILTVSDAVAAIVGRLLPLQPLGGLAKGKTVSGSAAFFVSALLIALLSLAGFTQLPVHSIVAVALVVASTTTVIEAISSRGLDNFLIPAVAFLAIDFLVFGV